MSKAEALNALKQGAALAKAGNRAAARPLVRRAVELDPQCEPAWVWAASLAESPRDALTALERALALNPANERTRTAAHAARFQTAVAAAKANRKAPARSLLRTVVAAEPGNEAAWMWLVNVAASADEAAACLERVLVINPANERARAGLERLRAARRPGPGAPVAPSRLAARATQPAWRCPLCQAEADCEPARCPGCRALLALGDAEAFFRLEDVDGGRVAAGLRLLRAKPGEPDFATRRSLGVGLLNLKQFDAAEAEFRAALGLQPADHELRGLLDALASRPPESAPAAAVRPRKVVLTVDDSPTIRKLVTMTLERRGYAVWTAADASFAVDVLRERGAPDLILLDIAMPGMDGYRLCKLLRQDRETSRIPIIMLSGKDGVFNKVRGMWAGCTSYVTKPFEPDGLLRVLQRHCPADDGPQG